MDLVAPQHVGSSQTRDRTRVPRVGRRILNHCATREVPRIHIFVCHVCAVFLAPRMMPGVQKALNKYLLKKMNDYISKDTMFLLSFFFFL